MIISIIILAYNQERFILETLVSAAAQTRLADEIIIVDDASTDATAATISGFIGVHTGLPLKFLRNERNLGVTGSLAGAVAIAKGEIIVLMAGDDVSVPTRIERCHAHFRDSPGSMAVIANAKVIDDQSQPSGFLDNCIGKTELTRLSLSGLQRNEHFLRGRSACGAAAAYRAEIFKKFGPFRRGLYAEDEPAAFRAMLLGTCDFLPETLVYWRRHSSNLSHGGGLSYGPDLAGHFRKCERMVEQMISDAEEHTIHSDSNVLQGLVNALSGLRLQKAKWTLWAAACEKGLPLRAFFRALEDLWKCAPSFAEFIQLSWRPSCKILTPFSVQRTFRRLIHRK
jgi:glycosyltransferase involved in cell wall biosynthesis